VNAGPSIEAEHLSRRFGDFLAVDDVSFHVEKGEIFGYLGANGAGKSTTGHDVASDPEGVKSAIGYMSQKFSLYLDLPVEENLRFFGGAYGLWGGELKKRADEVLELTGLAEHRKAITGSLPGGIRQRLALGSAVLHRPSIVFLDEPTAGVDPEARRSFWRLIRELSRGGTTVFVTTHYLDEAEYCRRIGLMVDGRLVALDTPAELKRAWVPDRVLMVRGRNLTNGAADLRARPGVRAAEPFGAGLHLRVDPAAWTGDAVRTTLEAAGGEAVSVEEAEPTLEDVFLAVVGRGAEAQAAQEATP
jgi:ABC-2 type transport system ATP-binding protein